MIKQEPLLVYAGGGFVMLTFFGEGGIMNIILDL